MIELDESNEQAQYQYQQTFLPAADPKRVQLVPEQYDNFVLVLPALNANTPPSTLPLSHHTGLISTPSDHRMTIRYIIILYHHKCSIVLRHAVIRRSLTCIPTNTNQPGLNITFPLFSDSYNNTTVSEGSTNTSLFEHGHILFSSD